MPPRRRASYGIDAPYVPRNLAVAGVAGLFLALVAHLVGDALPPVLSGVFLGWGLWGGLSCLLSAGIFLWGSLVGKLRLRDRLLGTIPWRGDEIVLDVGCGRGLLLLGAAQRLSTGKAVGIDLWRSEDLSGNRPANTWTNAQIEGVSTRVAIVTGDTRSLPFADGVFDVIVSSTVLHNIYDRTQRQHALVEIVRVLKTGGRLCLFDIRHTREYLQTLRAHGFGALQHSGPTFFFGFPAYLVTGTKPTVPQS